MSASVPLLAHYGTHVRSIGAWLGHGGLNGEQWLRVVRNVLVSRFLDELEIELVRTGEVRYQFSASGHELSQAILCIRPADRVAA